MITNGHYPEFMWESFHEEDQIGPENMSVWLLRFAVIGNKVQQQMFCNDHSYVERYCVCEYSRQDEKDNLNMLLCHYCGIWFHIKCVDLTIKDYDKYS